MVQFLWPSMWAYVLHWCHLVNQPAIAKALLCLLLLMEVPFECTDMDLFGPLYQSAQGYHFVFVLVDYVAYYADIQRQCCCAPLLQRVCTGTFQVISHVGILKDILTDRGTLFMSHTLKELYKLLGINLFGPVSTTLRLMDWWSG